MPKSDAPTTRQRIRRQTQSRDALDRAEAAMLAAEKMDPGGPTLDRVLTRLSQDETPAVRKVTATALARALERATGLVRVQLVATWVNRAGPWQRLAIARALRWNPTKVGGPSALEHLAEDRNPRVRKAAVQAAARRPRWFRSLLRSASRDDPQADVRATARVALAQRQAKRKRHRTADC